ncbi:MAG TPA: ferrochelatase [Vicinamibacterales bacterium]|nr:ferrochelatase [Vicinamibacterales bacterium]
MKHVVVVTYGEPMTAAFVDQLVYSWRILIGLTRSVADIPAPLLPLIALSRGRGRNAMWKREGYTSPLEPITIAQAERLRSALASQSGDEWKVHVAYEFRTPLVGPVIENIPANDEVFVAPMYAADSAFTHELSRQAVAAVSSRRARPVVVLPALAADVLAELSARHVMKFLEAESVESRSTALVLAAHGTLLQPSRPIETGYVATEQLCRGIERRLSESFGLIANGWLNHTRGGKWTEPAIEETLSRVSALGYKEVVYYPYGFLADNAESQLEGRMAAAAHPGMRVRFVPCFNESPDLADTIAAQIARLRQEPA